jgi:hypothetical protein
MISRIYVFFCFVILAALSARAESYYSYYSYYTPAQPIYRPYGNDEDSSGGDIVHGGSRPLVRGSRAIVRNGIAYAPADAPDPVKRAIWATNALRRKPYKWGGGHGSFYDSGYDCSGTVCFALHNAGVLGSPIPSSDLLSFGEPGRGRWITVYSRSGHSFAMIAGLRLDTTGCYGTEGPRWHADGRDTFGYEARHPAGF